jgi:acyl-CoA synthetase (AMP-forming)/AMP-acid ligase II
MKHILIAPLLVFCVLLFGCAKASAPAVPGAPSGTNATLAKIVQAETAVETSVAGALKITQQLYSGGFIDKTTAGNISSVLATITQANAQALQLTQGLTTISATQALTLQNIEAPIIQALQNLIDSGLVGIKDANSKAAISAVLSTLLVTLQIIQGGS